MRARAKHATVDAGQTAKESREAPRLDVDVPQAPNGKAAEASPGSRGLLVLGHLQENGTPHTGSEARNTVRKLPLHRGEERVFRAIPGAMVGEKKAGA